MVDKETLDGWYEKRMDISQNMTEKEEEVAEEVDKCEYGFCDGSGEYEEEFAVDDVRTVKCPCKMHVEYEPEYDPSKEL